MSGIWAQLSEQLLSLWAYVPRIIGALAVLVVGYIFARILRRATRSLLGKVEIDNRIAEMMRGEPKEGEEKRPLNVESMIATGVYYIVLTAVAILVLQTLALTQVIEPLNVFLTEIIGYIPNIIGPAFLLLIAWVTASVVRALVSKGLTAARIDDRFERQMGRTEGFPEVEEGVAPGEAAEAAEAEMTEEAREGRGFSMARSVAEMAYWFVFLLFLPAILDGLRLEGILAPVRDMVNEFLAFIPNLFAAAVIFAVGYFVARLVQRITANFLESAGADRVVGKAGLEEVMGSRSLSSMIGYVVFALILIPVAVAALNALEIAAVTEPASAMLNSFLAAVPDIFAATLVIAIAYAAGRLLGSVVETVLDGVGFDRIPERIGLTMEQAEEGRAPSEIAGIVVFAAVLLLGTMEGFSTLGFATLSGLLGQFAVFGGKVLLGIAVFGVGLYLAQLAAEGIRKSGVANRETVATVARVSIIVLTAAMALREMGIADQIINLAFGIGFGAIAISVALAFGLGGREPAGDLFREFVDRFRESGSSPSGGGPGEHHGGDESDEGPTYPTGGEEPHRPGAE